MMVFVLLDGIADVDGLMGMDMLEVCSRIECDGGNHPACAVVFEFELYVLEVLAYEFRSAEVEDVSCAEDRFLIARSEWIEFLQPCHEVRSDVGKCDVGVDVELRAKLIGLNVFGYIFLKQPAEFLYVLFLERESDGISVAAEILQEVAGGVDR